MSYSLVLAGFETKEQAEKFLSWYGNSGEQHFGDHLDCQDGDVSFVPVNYHKTPEWFGDNYVAHITIHKKDDEE